MFYSQTILARKGPLGTVWCAAHLQHRLKKSHYTSTDISSTVDRIMFPEVPIALRMSGHLLLGVVRIYCKKVEYLFHDCNVVLVGFKKNFAPNQVNLPENATTAKFEAVTLPQTFDLDAVDISDAISIQGSPDNNLRHRDEITLADQIPTGRDPYIAISFDEDFMVDMSLSDQDPNGDVRPMDEDILPPPRADTDVAFQDVSSKKGTDSFHNTDEPNQTRVDSLNQTELLTDILDFQDPSPSNQTELLTGILDFQDPSPSNQTERFTDILDFQDPGPSNQTELLTDILDFHDPGPSNQTEVIFPRHSDNSPPEIEILRDHPRTDNFHPVLPDFQVNSTDPKIPSLNQVLNEKDVLSPIVEDTFSSGGKSPPFQQPSESGASRVADGIYAPPSFGMSPELNICSSPPVQQLQNKKRKRKRFFDENTVLTNEFMKKALKKSEDLLRKRGNLRPSPLSSLGAWKRHNSLRKEQIFYQPSITGCSTDISLLFEKDYISTRPHLICNPEDVPRANAALETEEVLEAEDVPRANVPNLSALETDEILEAEDVPRANVPNLQALETDVALEAGNASSPPRASDANPEHVLADPPGSEQETPMEIECLRHNEGFDGNRVLPDLFSSPARVVHSPFRREDFPPKLGSSIGSETVPLAKMAGETEQPRTHDGSGPSLNFDSEFETAKTPLDERYALSDTPDLMNTAEAEDLYFLEADNTPAGSQATQGVDSLSVRTRGVAQYLKRHSPVMSMAEEPCAELRLNEILKGKTRKLCARMFYETLVLKSYALVGVEQKKPYGDIVLKLTPTLSKLQL